VGAIWGYEGLRFSGRGWNSHLLSSGALRLKADEGPRVRGGPGRFSGIPVSGQKQTQGRWTLRREAKEKGCGSRYRVVAGSVWPRVGGFDWKWGQGTRKEVGIISRGRALGANNIFGHEDGDKVKAWALHGLWGTAGGEYI